MRRPIALLAVAALLAALAGCGRGTGTRGGSPPGASSIAEVGQNAPRFSDPLSTGGTLDSASLRGKPVYLNFFASWCPPCNEEAPTINALQKEFSKDGLLVIGVDELENAADANEFREKYGLVYPIVVDSGELEDQYGVYGLPVHVFIERDGVVKEIETGEMTRPEIERAIKSIL